MKARTNLHFLSIIIVLTFLVNIPSLLAQESNQFTVVLDAGHGGREPGKVSKSGIKEKDIALKIILAVGKELEKKPNIKVVYTRKTDVFVDLFVRGKIANKAEADLFVSVHCNAHHSQAYGAETYVLGLHRNETNFNVAKAENEVIYYEKNYEKNYAGFDPSSPESYIGLTLMQEDYLDQSILLASFIQDNFTNTLKRKNRGVKQAGFIVLHQTVMPSVLIETGFITNTKEGKYLNSSKGQTEMSKAITKAILDYKKSVNESIGEFVLIPEKKETPIDTINSEPKQVIENTIFKVQIAASSRKLETKSYNFKGLNNITREKTGRIYKYFYNETSDYNLIKKLKTKAKQKGYKSCFIVAYRDGKKITLAQALKSERK